MKQNVAKTKALWRLHSITCEATSSVEIRNRAQIKYVSVFVESCFVLCNDDFSSGLIKTVITYQASGFFVACRTPKAIAPTLAVQTMTIRGAIWKGNKIKMK